MNVRNVSFSLCYLISFNVFYRLSVGLRLDFCQTASQYSVLICYDLVRCLKIADRCI